MSFLQSNLNIGDLKKIVLSGSNGIASTNYENKGIYYTTNSGETWTQSKIKWRNDYNNLKDRTGIGNYLGLALSGLNGIAGDWDGTQNGGTGIYYTTDGGQNWTSSDMNGGNYPYISNLSGSNAVVSGSSGDSYIGFILYTKDSGKNWTRKKFQSKNYPFIHIYLSGLNGIASSNNGSDFFYTKDLKEGLYYTKDGGENWKQSNITTTRRINSISLSGLNGIASTYGIIYYTTNSGETWKETKIDKVGFEGLALSGLNGIAISYIQEIIGRDYVPKYGIHYTTDGGQNWYKGNITTEQINSISLVGLVGIAGTKSGLLITKDGGKTWSNVLSSGVFYSVFIDPTTFRAIASSDNGIYYSSGPLYTEEKIEKMIEKTNIEKKDVETKLVAMDKISDCSNAEMEYNNNIARLRLELQLNDLIKNKELLEAHKLSLSARNSDASILLSDKNRLLATVNSNIQQRYTKLEDVNDKINTITQDIYTNNMEMKRKENIIQTLKIIIIIVVIMVVILMVYFGMEYVDKTNPGVFQDFFNKFNNTIYV
jgi:photosystem II stability/assembly factor-like uncharacterized protein